MADGNEVPNLTCCHGCGLREVTSRRAMNKRTMNRALADERFVRRARRALSAHDAIMSRIIKTVGAFRPNTVDGVFEALVLSIVHQQVSMKAAQTICRRVRDLCPAPVYYGLRDDTMFPGRPARRRIVTPQGCLRPQRMRSFRRQASEPSSTAPSVRRRHHHLPQRHQGSWGVDLRNDSHLHPAASRRVAGR